MKTLHLYLIRQVLATLVMTVGVFTFVLLLGSVLKEILSLLVNRQATFLDVANAVALLIPFVLAFALPMGMLTAALLVFGRFSADHELTAVRSSGMSLIALITPILALSLVLCGFSAWMNLEIAPRCRVAYNDLRYRMGLKMAGTLLPEDTYVTYASSNTLYTIYVKRNVNNGEKLSDILVFRRADLENDYDPIAFKAPRGRLDITGTNATLRLYQAQTLVRAQTNYSIAEADYSFELKTQAGDASTRTTPVSDMTFRQLNAELTRLESRFNAPNPAGKSGEENRQWLRELQKQEQDLTMPLRVQIHREIAVSFACFGFTLVGIPLGIRAHRRETNIGIAMALALVFIYYAFIVVAQALQMHPGYAPQLIVWLPNFIFQSAGAVMLWRANRGILTGNHGWVLRR